MTVRVQRNRTRNKDDEYLWGTLSSNAAPFFHLFLNILHKHNDIAKSPKYVHMKLKCRVIAKPEKKIKEPKKRKRNADEASPHMADDGKQFQQVMTPSGRIKKVLVR